MKRFFTFYVYQLIIREQYIDGEKYLQNAILVRNMEYKFN